MLEQISVSLVKYQTITFRDDSVRKVRPVYLFGGTTLGVARCDATKVGHAASPTVSRDV